MGKKQGERRKIEQIVRGKNLMEVRKRERERERERKR